MGSWIEGLCDIGMGLRAWRDAIDARVSRRTFVAEGLGAHRIKQLYSLIDACNSEGDLHMQLCLDAPEAFSSFIHSYGLLRGVRHFIAVVGKTDPLGLEHMGRYGQCCVLAATSMGLGSSWIGGSFSRSEVVCDIDEGESLWAVIVLGLVSEKVGVRERLIRGLLHRRLHAIDKISEIEGEVPVFWEDGLNAALKSPSAMNRFPVRFCCRDGEVSARVSGEGVEYIDLGIAKCHFEIGVGHGRFQDGNGGIFIGSR